MTTPSTADIVARFTQTLQDRLDPDRLDGPVRLDNTHTVAIIPLKGKGPIHAHIHGGLDDAGIENVVSQIRAVPSLSGLVTREK
jgi:hypothetical protein